MYHMAYEPRAATPTDFDAVMRLYRQLNARDPVLEDGTDRRVYERICESEHLHILVLDSGGSVVATAYLNVIPNVTRSARPYAIIENVVVEEGLRGQGLGKRILMYALRRAWHEGCYKAMLMTGSKKEATLAFYESCGFSRSDKTGFVARPPTISSSAAGEPGQGGAA